MMPSWVSADPDHVFWMRVVLALAEGIWIPLAGFAGFLLFRWRERARLEEQTMADLRKLRFDTLAEVMNAWMAHYRAHIEVRHLRGILEQAMAPSDIEQLRRLVAEAELREKQSVTVFTDLMMAKAMLLPEMITAAYMRYLNAPEHTRQRERAVGEVEAAFKAYLPKLREQWRPIWKLRYRIATWAGADEEEVGPRSPR